MPAHRTTLFALRPLLASLLFVGLAPRAAVAQLTRTDTVFFYAVCKHDGYVNVSSYKCGSADSTLETFRAADVKSVRLSIELNDNRQFSQNIEPGTDALFLSNVAIEKFLLPYYVSVGDTKKAAALRAFLNRVASAGMQERRRRAAKEKKH